MSNDPAQQQAEQPEVPAEDVESDECGAQDSDGNVCSLPKGHGSDGDPNVTHVDQRSGVVFSAEAAGEVEPGTIADLPPQGAAFPNEAAVTESGDVTSTQGASSSQPGPSGPAAAGGSGASIPTTGGGLSTAP